MSGAVAWIALGLTIVLILLALDRLALWFERRGWIYYRKTTRQTGASLGDAFLEIQSMVDPGARHVIEERKHDQEEQAESGDPPEAGEQ